MTPSSIGNKLLIYLVSNYIFDPCHCWSNYHTTYINHRSISSRSVKKSPSILNLSSNNENYDDGQNPNLWSSGDEDMSNEYGEDWQDVLKKQQETPSWSSSYDEEETPQTPSTSIDPDNVDEEAWLDTLQAITAEEVTFMEKEADRADKMRQMQEYGYSSEAISATLGVATDETQFENKGDNSLLDEYRQNIKDDDLYSEIDPSEVESHTTAERDEDTNELIRSQMVYVDEHSCIGCTNCAMIAQSTFFMHEEHGRARVFQQWGDDDETVAIAIETCPVDCIHYVPYEELKKLEIERRDQNINFKARLVNQGESGGGSHRVGGAFQFTEAQKISGNMGSRCRNCPSAGCKNCPMYGVGENPKFRKREKLRKERRARKKMEEELKKNNKAADL